MKYTQGVYPIISKKALAAEIYDMTISCPEVAQAAVCGQFVNIKADGFMLRRPISICGIDKEKGTLRILCTDDGSAGRKGFVTDALAEVLSKEKPAVIYACGPSVMLKRIIAQAKDAGVRCQVSLEERMGCGVGGCLVCACRTIRDGEEYYAHVCKDGPVFNAEEVLFDD